MLKPGICNRISATACNSFACLRYACKIVLGVLQRVRLREFCSHALTGKGFTAPRDETYCKSRVKKNKYLLFLILLTTVFLYSPTFKNPFIWDDFHLVANDDSIKDFSNIPLLFRQHLFKSANSSNFYRPLQSLSFMADYSVWKLNPFGYHLTNLLLHLLNVVLVYLFARELFKDPRIGLLAGLIFAIHPINTEAVAYISGRADPLSVFFFLSAFIAYMRFKSLRKRPLYFLSVALYALSLLTKEAVFVFPAVVIFYDAIVLREGTVRTEGLKTYLWYFIVLFIYVSWRLFFMGLPSGLMSHPPFGMLLLTTPKILVSYLGLLLLPVSLHMERMEEVVLSVFDPQAIMPIIVLILFFLALKIFYRRSRPLFFCGGFFFITLLPMLNILLLNAMMAEHWLYMPAIGLYLITAFGFVKLLDRGMTTGKIRVFRNLAVFGLLGFLCFFSVRTILRNMEWGRPFEFYTNLLKSSPYSARGHLSLGALYITDNNLNLARKELLRAEELDPKSPLVYHKIGLIDYAEKDKGKAVEEWKRALEIAPFFQPARRTMNMYLRQDNKRFDRLFKAANEHPHNGMALYRLSKLYFQHDLYPEAIVALEKISQTDPAYANAVFNIAWCYSKMGLYQTAISGYKKVMALTPEDPDIYRNMAYCYVSLKNREEAYKCWKKAEGLVAHRN